MDTFSIPHPHLPTNFLFCCPKFFLNINSLVWNSHHLRKPHLPSFKTLHFFNVIYLVIYSWVFVAVYRLCCCLWACSSCGKQGLLPSCWVRSSHCGGFSCGAQALGHAGSIVVHSLSCPAACGILVLRPKIEPMFPSLTDRLLTTGPPGKSLKTLVKHHCWLINNQISVACCVAEISVNHKKTDTTLGLSPF